MSEENVEIVKEFTRRFAAGDRVTSEYFDPEIAWDTTAIRMFEAREQAFEATGLRE